MAEGLGAADERLLAAAVRLGARRNGSTWPNPAVGAFVVSDGVVVGAAATAPGGRPHAEPQALTEAGERARGSTLYVSLEPCSHHGRTPPCTDAVIAAGVARVVTAAGDPDPRVAGEGLRRLAAAGIAVDARDAAGDAHLGHATRMTLGRPYVLLKLALSAEGAIGREGEGQVALTGPIARRHVHALRVRFDAIMVGSGTIAADDPALTCRLPGLTQRSPARVVLATRGRLPRDARVFSDDGAATWVLSAMQAPKGFGDADPARLRWMTVPGGPGGIDLGEGLSALARAGITRLLLEGGARLAAGLLAHDLVDAVMLFETDVVIGPGAVPALAGMSLDAIRRSPSRWGLVRQRRFGTDLCRFYKRLR